MLRRLFVITALVLAAQAHAAEAGKVIFSAGAATIAGRAGAEGAAVQEGELLSTGADGFLYVKTIDNGLFILRPNTEARIVAYHVDTANPANTRVKLELLKGVARSKSGDAVKMARQNFRFNTPVAAIGVRGTDFTVYTDNDTSRIAVLTGGIVVSGFGGACRPDGAGPCEGTASRELSATQRGQLLQVQRGQNAPQLLQGGSATPDLVSPPRPDEPVAKAPGPSTNIAAEPVLDAQKSQSINQIIVQKPVTPAPTTPVVPVTPTSPTTPTTPTPPATPEEPVVTPPLVSDGGDTKPPATTPPVTTPVTPITPAIPTVPDTPTVPETPATPEPARQLQWGRWTTLANKAPTIALTAPAGADRIINGNFVLFFTAGKEFVSPVQGSIGFALKDSEAYVTTTNFFGTTVNQAKLSNGSLNVDFGSRTFTTSLDLLSGGSTSKLQAQGDVDARGRLFGDQSLSRPGYIDVQGGLSDDKGGTAAYLFNGRLDNERTVNGATSWTKK